MLSTSVESVRFFVCLEHTMTRRAIILKYLAEDLFFWLHTYLVRFNRWRKRI